MALDLSKLGPLVGAVEAAGAPIFAEALRAASGVSGAAPFPLNLVLPIALNALADAVGGSADDPGALAGKIATDPDAAAKIQAVEAAHSSDLESALAFAKLQVDQNGAAFNADLPIWAKIFFAGARPLQMWLTGPVMTLYQVAAASGHAAPVDPSIYVTMAAQFALLSGARTYEKQQGVASPMAIAPKTEGKNSRAASRSALARP